MERERNKRERERKMEATAEEGRKGKERDRDFTWSGLSLPECVWGQTQTPSRQAPETKTLMLHVRLNYNTRKLAINPNL